MCCHISVWSARQDVTHQRAASAINNQTEVRIQINLANPQLNPSDGNLGGGFAVKP